MPPEQAVGQPVFASDLYSLGLTAIFLLTGKRPYQLQDPATGSFIWRQYAPGVAPQLADVLDKATLPLPGNRYQSAREMKAAVMSVPHVPSRIQIDVPPNPPQPLPLARRKLIYALAGVLVLLTLGSASLAGMWWWRRPETLLAINGRMPLVPKSSCLLFNDERDQSTVNVRTNCDTRACDSDPSTIVKDYPNNTEVRVNREIKVKSKKGFYWTQIVIVEGGEIGWAASTKIRCQ